MHMPYLRDFEGEGTKQQDDCIYLTICGASAYRNGPRRRVGWLRGQPFLNERTELHRPPWPELPARTRQ